MGKDFEISESRQREMVKFPPLAPSGVWMSEFLGQMARKPFESDAAYPLASGPKEYARFTLIDKSGDLLKLTVPVEGGGRQLRSYTNLDNLVLSEHGDWRRVHLGAIEACLGRTPFFAEVFAGISSVYERKDLRRLQDFNTAIFRFIETFLLENIRPGELQEIYNNRLLIERGKEIAAIIKPEVSVLQSLAILGKETLVGLAVLRN